MMSTGHTPLPPEVLIEKWMLVLRAAGVLAGVAAALVSLPLGRFRPRQVQANDLHLFLYGTPVFYSRRLLILLLIL